MYVHIVQVYIYIYMCMCVPVYSYRYVLIIYNGHFSFSARSQSQLPITPRVTCRASGLTVAADRGRAFATRARAECGRPQVSWRFPTRKTRT